MDLILPQLGMLDFFDSPRENLRPLKSGWRAGWGEVGCSRKGKVGELELVCKMKKHFK